jgi:hypothetical protein
MRYIDWIVQSVLLVLGFLAVIAMLAGHESIMPFILAELILSIWQYLGCLMTRTTHIYLRRLRAVYLQLSTTYLVLLLFSITIPAPTVVPGTLYYVYAFVIPWCLAIFYYVITWRSAFRKKQRGSFLPHLSF